jgi:hypothetical protein
MEIEQTSIPEPVSSLQPGESSFIGRIKEKIVGFKHKNEKYSEIAIFGVGFVWDSLTMTRVDNPIDNVILLFYLVIIAAMIIITLRKQCGIAPPEWIEKHQSHFLYAMQFCFGGLFSSDVIFYFKSASLTRTIFFFLILVSLWIANEFLQQRLQNPDLLASLYSLCLFAFLSFFLPVMLEKVNVWIFLLAGFLSLVISLFIFYIGYSVRPDGWKRPMIRVAYWICGVVLTVYLLYFANLIPPVPLALKSTGIYHSVVRVSGGYEVKYVAPPWYRFWKKCDSPFYLSNGEVVYCFTSIFAPRNVSFHVRHVWSVKTPQGWKQTDVIVSKEEKPLRGGMDAGWRWYSRKQTVKPGQWRIDVETIQGQTIGEIDFEIVASPDPHPPLESRIIQ